LGEQSHIGNEQEQDADEAAGHDSLECATLDPQNSQHDNKFTEAKQDNKAAPGEVTETSELKSGAQDDTNSSSAKQDSFDNAVETSKDVFNGNKKGVNQEGLNKENKVNRQRDTMDGENSERSMTLNNKRASDSSRPRTSQTAREYKFFR
jgi:hypothetical protein